MNQLPGVIKAVARDRGSGDNFNIAHFPITRPVDGGDTPLDIRELIRQIANA